MFIPLNKAKVYLITFFSSFVLFYSPVIFLYYRNYNINLFQIGIIFSITSITTIIAEIPFGIFSDKKSPKLSILIGLSISLAGMAFMIIGNNFIFFILSAILMAIGDAGVSGANITLLLPLLDNENDLFDISTMTKTAANISGGLIIGIIYRYNVKFPFFISLILILINIFLYSTVKYENKIKTEKSENKTDKKEISFIETIKNNIFILIILFFSYISVPQIMIYFPEYLALNNFNAEIIGIMYMLANFTSFMGTKIHQKYMKEIKISVKLKFSMSAICICSFFMWQIRNVGFFLFFYFIYRIITGWFFQLFSIYINSKTPVKYKATLFSVKSVVMEFAFIISDPVVTFMISRNNIKISYMFTSVIILICLIMTVMAEKFFYKKL